MSTPFDFEFVFTASSVEAIVRAYFDADHLAAQDKVGDLVERRVTDSTEDADHKWCAWHVRANRALPGFVKPFVEGGRLAFVETMKWRKRDSQVDMTIVPQIAGGRVQIAGTYTLTPKGEGKVHRRYKGTISAGIPLLGGKIERGILEEFTKGISAMANCTQDWLAKHPT